MTKLQQYREGHVSASLVEVFHRIDHMLADGAYSSELALLKRDPGLQSEDAHNGPDDGEGPQVQLCPSSFRFRLFIVWCAPGLLA